MSDTPITKAAFNHWMGDRGVVHREHDNAVNPVVPEPPKYTACIARNRELAAQEAKTTHKTATEAELKQRCETAYKNFNTEVMSFLLSSQWVIAEGNALKIKLTDAEVKKQFPKIKGDAVQQTDGIRKIPHRVAPSRCPTSC